MMVEPFDAICFSELGSAHLKSLQVSGFFLVPEKRRANYCSEQFRSDQASITMFVYRPPKASCWGHSVRKATFGLQAFIDSYFERVESQSATTLVLAWKESVLPKVSWAEVFLGAENQKLRQFLFSIVGDRVMFPMGIFFPLSTAERESFEFLGKFSTDAPFKMSAKHFQIGVVKKNGRFAWRKPDEVVACRLQEFVA